jgi:hypothetical protein
MTHSTALSRSASSNMMRALFPPSSHVAGRRLVAAASATLRPVAVLPVNASLATPGWELQGSRAETAVGKAIERMKQVASSNRASVRTEFEAAKSGGPAKGATAQAGSADAGAKTPAHRRGPSPSHSTAALPAAPRTRAAPPPPGPAP